MSNDGEFAASHMVISVGLLLPSQAQACELTRRFSKITDSRDVSHRLVATISACIEFATSSSRPPSSPAHPGSNCGSQVCGKLHPNSVRIPRTAE